MDLANFPYKQDYFSLNKSNSFVSWHWHEDFEIIIVKEGSLKLHMNLEDIIMSKNDISLVNSNILHFLELYDCNECTYYTISFSPDLITSDKLSSTFINYMLPLIEAESFPGILLSDDISWQKEMKHDILNCFHSYEYQLFGYELFIQSKLFAIFYLLVQNYHNLTHSNKEGWTKDYEHVKDIILYMEKNYAISLTMDQIAAHVKIHKRECFRCFQRALGISPIEYLLQYRISMGAHLLRGTKLPVYVISKEVGIESPSHFSKTFKARMHCTPNQYRK